jgi:DNA-directed RNA polymerase specialized sigma24 family protein
LAGSGGWNRSASDFEDWENDLLAWAARKAKLSDREDLWSELAIRLRVLKSDPPTGIRNRRAYIRTFLRNKALNWIRNQRRREALSLDQPIGGDYDEAFTLGETLGTPDSNHVERIAWATALEALAPDLIAVLQEYIDANGNVSETGRRMGVHPNTIRARMNKIRRVLAAHGLRPPGKPRTPRSRIGRLVAAPTVMLPSTAPRNLRGAQARIVFWVRGETTRRKRKMITFSWSRIAQDLNLNRSTASRAGRKLIQSQVLFLQNGKIGRIRQHKGR